MLTNFNGYYFAQLDKQGAVIDERYNSGGQAADYIINAMQRTLIQLVGTALWNGLPPHSAGLDPRTQGDDHQ